MRPKVNHAEAAERRDLDMLRHPNNWPCWPMLPMKRRNRSHLDTPFYCGLVVAFNNHRVYNLNMFGLPQADTWEKALADIPYEEFESLEGLIREWRVD